MPKYPLKPLLEHRVQTVTDATEELAKAMRGRRTAEEMRQHAEAERREAEARAREVREQEAARLGRGELRAIDLARVEAWDVGARAQIGELARAEVVAERRATDATAAEVSALADLAQKTADRDVVVKDKARFEESEKRRALAAEEEAMAEIFGARKRS